MKNKKNQKRINTNVTGVREIIGIKSVLFKVYVPLELVESPSLLSLSRNRKQRNEQLNNVGKYKSIEIPEKIIMREGEMKNN